MDYSEILVPLIITLGASAAAFGGVMWLYPRLKHEKQGYPLEAEIEAALLPFVLAAVQAAYEAGERAFVEIGKVMDGADKKAFADSVYRLLPAQIGTFPVMFVKSIIPPERWAQMVQDAYDATRAEVMQHKEHFDKLYEDWLAENTDEIVA